MLKLAYAIGYKLALAEFVDDHPANSAEVFLSTLQNMGSTGNPLAHKQIRELEEDDSERPQFDVDGQTASNLDLSNFGVDMPDTTDTSV